MSFENALDFVLFWEGGDKITNDPADPGKLTKWGISQAANPDIDVANLTRAGAADIYRERYWDASGCPGLAAPLALVVFDSSVNCGVKRAKNWLNASSAAPKQLDELLVRRAEHYASLPSRVRFGRGWFRRLIAVHRAALEMEGKTL